MGGAIGEPIPYGYLDAGPGFSILNPVTGQVSNGGLRYAAADAFTANLDWAITPTIGIFGRYSFATTKLNPIDAKVKTQSFQVGVGVSDLGKKGTLAVLTYLVPMDITRAVSTLLRVPGMGRPSRRLRRPISIPLTTTSRSCHRSTRFLSQTTLIAIPRSSWVICEHSLASN